MPVLNSFSKGEKKRLSCFQVILNSFYFFFSQRTHFWHISVFCSLQCCLGNGFLFSVTPSFFFLFPVLFNYVLLEKLVSAKLEKKSGRLWPFFFPQPLVNLVTASLSLTPLLVVNQILISQVTSVSRARACLSVDIPVPSSKFPSRQPSRPHLSLANLLRAIFCSPRILSKHQTLSLLPCLQFSVQLIS